MALFRSVRSPTSVCCGAFALALGGPAPETSAPSFSLEWDAPADCPSSAEFLTQVESLLGRSLAPPLGEGMQVQAQASQTAAGWRVVLKVQTPDGERGRELPAAKSCADATKAAALVVAIAIDPDVQMLPAPPEPAEPERKAAPPEPEPESEAEPESESERKAAPPETVAPEVSESPPPPPRAGRPSARPPLTFRGFAGLDAQLGFGGLPNVGAGFSLSAGLLGTGKLIGFRVGLDGRYWLARTEDLGPADVVFRQWTVGVLAGPSFSLPLNFDVAPMAGFEGGQIIVRDEGLPASEDPSDPWAAARLRLQAGWSPVRWVAPLLGVEMVVPLRRTRFQVDGAGTVHQASSVGVRGVLGLEARFP